MREIDILKIFCENSQFLKIFWEPSSPVPTLFAALTLVRKEEIVAPGVETLETTEGTVNQEVGTPEAVIADPEIDSMETDQNPETEVTQDQKETISPKDQMADQNPHIHPETDTETTLIAEALRGIDMIKEIGHIVEIEETDPEDTTDPGINPPDNPQDTPVEEGTDLEEGIGLPLEMTGTAAALETTLDPGAGETVEEAAVGRPSRTTKLIL